MNADYICPKLKQLMLLFYGKDCKPFSKEKKGMFVFGSTKLDVTNKVTKEVAIYLVIGNFKHIIKSKT